MDKFKNLSLRARLIVAFVLFSVIPSVIIASVVFAVSRNAIEDKVSAMTYEVGAHIAHTIDHILAETNKITLLPFSNRELLSDFEKKDISDFELLQIKREANNYFVSLRYSNPTVNNLFFVRDDGHVFGDYSLDFDVDTFLGSEIHNKVYEEHGRILWVAGYEEDHENIYVLRSVKSSYGQDLGVLILTIKRGLFDNVFSVSEDNNKEIYIINEADTIVASNNEENIGNSLTVHHERSNQHLMSISESTNGWQVVITTAKSALMREVNQVAYIVMIIVLALVCIAILGGFFVAFSITKPIDKICSLMKRAEKGDLKVRTDYVGKNEIGQLGQGFNHMLENLTNIIEENKRVSVRAVESSSKLMRISNDSSHTAEQIAVAIDEMAKGAGEQVDMAEKTKHEMEVLSKEIRDVTLNVKNIGASTDKTKQLSNLSIRNIEELTTIHSEVGTNLGQIDGTIEKLHQDVSGIKGIISMIKNISDQTNLLSLNASIEAARAGEAGRGFAVVAEEVRNLADQSKQSTVEIEKILNNILAQTENSVQLVKTSNSLFDKQTDSIVQTKGSFEEIIEDTNDIINEMKFIEAAVERMNQNRHRVEEAISQMVHVAEISSATTEEITATTQEQFAAAEELGKLSENLATTMNDLEEMISRFK